MDVSVIITDLETREIIEANDLFCHVFDYKAEEIIGVPYTSLNIFDDINQFKEGVKLFWKEQKLKDFKLRLKDKHGDVITGLFTCNTYQIENRSYLVTVMKDITAFDQDVHTYDKYYTAINQMIETLSDATWVVNQNGIIEDVNDKALLYLNTSKEHVIGQNIKILDPSITNDIYQKWLNDVKVNGVSQFTKSYNVESNKIYLEIASTYMEINNNQYLIITSKDVTEKMQIHEQIKLIEEELSTRSKWLKINENRQKAIFNALPDMMFVYNEKGDFIDCQVSDHDALKFNKEYFIHKNVFEVLPKAIASKTLTAINATLKDHQLKHFDYDLEINGRLKSYEARLVRSTENEVLAIVRDITVQKQEEQLILDLSYKDFLTGAYNRRYFESYLKDINEKKYLPVSIFVIDVNGLKLTNDAFGHLVGDELLVRVVDVLKRESPASAMIARIGGDEFAIVIPNYDQASAQQLLEQIYNGIKREKVGHVVVSISAGFETRDSMVDSISDVFIRADNHMFKRKITESQYMRETTVQVILNALNNKSQQEKLHAELVSQYALKMGESMNLSSHGMKALEMAALVHDIGKISVDLDLLNLPRTLTVTEYNSVKKHVEIGYQIIKSVDAYASIADSVLSHHEKFDGSGYPRGLIGQDIPLFARIISIADAYEAMTSNRLYRSPLTHEEAIKELNDYAGKEFDPDLVRIFEESFIN